MTIMDRSVLYQINSLEKPQKISGFLKEKGYSRQNLVDLRRDERNAQAQVQVLQAAEQDAAPDGCGRLPQF